LNEKPKADIVSYNDGPQVVSTSVSRFGKGRRKNSVFEVVEIKHTASPARPARPDLLKDPSPDQGQTMSDSSYSDGQEVTSSIITSNETTPTSAQHSEIKSDYDEKRKLRRALVDRLVSTLGEQVLEGVDVEAILDLEQSTEEQIGLTVSRFCTFRLSKLNLSGIQTNQTLPSGSQAEAAPQNTEKPIVNITPQPVTTPKKGMFGLFKSSKKTPSSLPQPTGSRSVSAREPSISLI